ncbi:CKLF-like MARVEL transmembrane domain-containing protein 8 isoform X1 [Aquarana catesbeiana]|uniref:CKLF-like MARVEL transmembrane domain-containing protein 8 isoform X1 n=1 Tax=Aquarana catesbeiana TaxID=8400 RepID=UPI003CCA39C0
MQPLQLSPPCRSHQQRGEISSTRSCTSLCSHNTPSSLPTLVSAFSRLWQLTPALLWSSSRPCTSCFPALPPASSRQLHKVFGLLVWALIAGSEYFLFPAFGWVMFVAVFYWVLTVFLLILYITRAYTKIPKVPWALVSLCFYGSAFVLYLIAAVVDATSITKEILDNHNYNSWTSSAFFAFLVTVCYAVSTYFSFRSWRIQS